MSELKNSYTEALYELEVRQRESKYIADSILGSYTKSDAISMQMFDRYVESRQQVDNTIRVIFQILYEKVFVDKIESVHVKFNSLEE